MLRLRLVLPLILFGIIIFFLWRGMGRDPNLLPSMLVGKPVPEFAAPDLMMPGNTIRNDIFYHKVTLLNVWATWCNNCRIEHPLLMDLVKVNQVQLIGLDYKDQRQAASQFLSQFGNPYQQVIYDDQGKYAMQFGVYGTPETFLIDKKGIIRYRFVGAMTLNFLEKDLLPRIQALREEIE